MIVGEVSGLRHRSSPLSRLVLKLIRVSRVRTDGIQVVLLSSSRAPPYLTGVAEVAQRRRASMLNMNERNIPGSMTQSLICYLVFRFESLLEGGKLGLGTT
jgi:hypothetical protein